MLPFLNIAVYKFTQLGNPEQFNSREELRKDLKQLCKDLELKGSILLSREGINLFIAGFPEKVEALLTYLRRIPGLEDLDAKRSESAEQPFNRMLVKIKQEIIAFGIEGIDPVRQSSPRISARDLKALLDDGRPVTLLDTRNDYEVKLGTFTGATRLGIDHFREFPEAIRSIPDSLKDSMVVTFCTGGIRCEKAAPLLAREGFQNVLQLEGGILKYFEECGGAHYEGECFVFDKRVGLAPDLKETGSQLCFACQMPLTVEELKDPRYQYEVSCPSCYQEK
jgi:predicted sulfurtransferase